jgi:hypothetical protein
MSNHTFNKDVIIGALGAIAGLVGIGYGVAMHTKLSKVSERLDTSINDLANNMEIDVPEAIINEAIEKAVTVEAKKAVQTATKEALDKLKRDIHNTVSAAVEKEYANIKDSVLRETTDAAAKINVERVRKDIETAARKQAMAKFNDNLDDILGRFNDNLNNVSKIYSSMANAATRNPDKEFVFKLN